MKVVLLRNDPVQRVSDPSGTASVPSITFTSLQFVEDLFGYLFLSFRTTFFLDIRAWLMLLLFGYLWSLANAFVVIIILIQI